MRKPTLSFCITCKNRFHQISQTLRKNLDDNRLQQNQIEFILVDFGSTDGLKVWVAANFKAELASGYLKYCYTDELLYWHACIAKNTTHLLANNDILVNLDCDNYTGYEGGQFVINLFTERGMDIVLHQHSGIFFDGSFGRISVQKKYFSIICGYDESLEPMGFEDNDFIIRLEMIGLQHIAASDCIYNKAIKNSKEEGLIYTGSSKGFLEMLQSNQDRSKQNIENGRLIANNGIYGVRKNLYDYQGKCLIL